MATVRLPALVVKTFEDLLATTRLQPEYMLMELVLFEIRLGFWLLLDLLAKALLETKYVLIALCFPLAKAKLQSEYMHPRLVKPLAFVLKTFEDLVATTRLLAFVVKTFEDLLAKLPILLVSLKMSLLRLLALTFVVKTFEDLVAKPLRLKSAFTRSWLRPW